MAITKTTLPDGSVRWKVRERDERGYFYPQRTFDRKADAERHKGALLQQRDHGTRASDLSQRKIPFNDYWQLWSSECRRKTSEGWKQSQDQLWRDYIEPCLGARPLGEIKAREIGDMLSYAQDLRNLKPESLLRIYSLVHKMFQDAIDHYQFVTSTPVLKKYRPEISLIERDFLQTEESLRLLETARDHWLGPAIWIMLLSGLRTSEVQALLVSSVDFERDQILIRASYARKVKKIQDYPKQKAAGRAPMPAMLSEYLRIKCQGKSPSDFVCADKTGTMLNHNFLWRDLRILCDQAKVPRVTPHELRHSCTELYVQQGASAEDIRRLLNHSSLTSTARYMHRTEGRLQGIASRVGISPKTPDPTPPAPEPRVSEPVKNPAPVFRVIAGGRK